MPALPPVPGRHHLDPRLLRAFLAVAEELHFTRAAVRLYVAQQALSRDVRRLERELGAELFVRSTRQVTLTADGERLVPYARRVLQAQDELLAAQNFHGAADAVRLAGWQQQRHQLRVRLLGGRVADEWFGADEAYLEEALAESRQPPAGTPANEDELRHRQYMQQVLRDAIGRAGPARRLDALPAS